MDRVETVEMEVTVEMVVGAGEVERDLETFPEEMEGMEASPAKVQAEATGEKVPKLPSAPSRSINLS